MRVSNLQTVDGPRLGVKVDGAWRVVDVPGAPLSVDELVRTGAEGRLRAEAAAAETLPVDDPRLALCVPIPGKIICIGLNYNQHAIEAGMPLTETPTMFSKFNSALTPADSTVTLPATAEQYDYESELGVVIGTRAVEVSVQDALDHVWGYCTTNDLSARDLQMRSTQFLLGKTLDGFLPVGPELVSADEVPDVQDLTVRTWLNGEIRQDGNTSDMVFTVAQIISYISDYFPLESGDLIVTGTPEGVIMGRPAPQQWMKAGDIVEVEIGGLGRLRTTLIAPAGLARASVA